MIITSPTHDWFSHAIEGCTTSLAVASPYVGAYLNEQTAKLHKNVAITLLTRTSLADFASHASDLEAVFEIAQRNGGVLSLASLHAKVYVVDAKIALVTSANATSSGMRRNRECGVQLSNPQDVSELSRLILSGFEAAPRPQLWTPDELSELREPVKALRAALPRKLKAHKSEIDGPPKVLLSSKQLSQVLETLPAWTRLTLEGISSIPSDHFTMDQVWSSCHSLAHSRFPNNRHVRQKLRQQMQRLRDLGLVLFLGSGHYQRLTYIQ